MAEIQHHTLQELWIQSADGNNAPFIGMRGMLYWTGSAWAKWTGGVTVSATDLDIRDLTHVSDSILVYGADTTATHQVLPINDQKHAIGKAVDTQGILYYTGVSNWGDGTVGPQRGDKEGRAILSHQVVSGTIDADEETVSLTLTPNAATVGIYISGAYTGQMEFETTIDDTTWVSHDVQNGATNQYVNATVGTGYFIAQVAGFLKLRVRASALTNGSAVITLIDSFGSHIVNLGGGDASIGKLGANSGVDIGDVTINNASLAVTGTFWQATQPVSATNLDIRDLAQATDGVTVYGLGHDAAVNALRQADPKTGQDKALNVQGGVCLTSSPALGDFNVFPVRLTTRGETMAAIFDSSGNAVDPAKESGGNLAAAATSLGNLDNSVDGNYLNVNLNMAGTDAAANAGAISAQTQRVVQAYNTDWITLRVNYAASAQTNTSMITAAANEKIIVKSLQVKLDAACTVTDGVAVLIGFDDTTTPTGADCIYSHPGLYPGGGDNLYFGSDGVTGGTAADDLKITADAATDGSISVVIVYKIITV